VGLDGSTISSSKNPGFSSGRTNNTGHLNLTSSTYFQSAVVPADEYKIPHHRQYLAVIHKPKTGQNAFAEQ